MSSLFKLPDSKKRSTKSPKLTLPLGLINQKLHKNNQSDSSATISGISTPPSPGNQLTSILNDNKPTLSTIETQGPNIQLSSNFLHPISTNRPVPPTLHVNKNISIDGLDKQLIHSIESLQVSEVNNSINTVDNITQKQPYNSTNIINGDNKFLPTGQPLLKDVDQLEEEMWKYVHIKNEIIELGILGEGAGGSVVKCRLKNGFKIFALKTITTLNTEPEFQKQILRELQFNKTCRSEYIVQYYGMFTDEKNSSIYIAMEYMGGGSLDAIYKTLLKNGGRIGEKVLGKIAERVLRGLSYLHERKIIHRDIKPQNILLNDLGQVKLCDFGVSGEVVNSLATTFTGTSYYMAPERIQGQPYSVTSDVWSLGLTLLEVAQGYFPFGSTNTSRNMPPIELLMLILTFTPELKDEPDSNIIWSKSFKSFIGYCLKKESRERPSPRQMIKHPWIQGHMKRTVDMQKFIIKCWKD